MQDPSTLYVTLATAAATLIGLLFVAIPLTVSRSMTEQERTGVEIQASGCMLCFIDVLVVTLFGLEGRTSVGPAAITLGLIGIAYALASLRSLKIVVTKWRVSVSQLGFSVTLLIFFALQLYAGIHIIAGQLKGADALEAFSILPIVILVVGVARTWQLVGLRNTGIISSVTTIVNGKKHNR